MTSSAALLEVAEQGLAAAKAAGADQAEIFAEWHRSAGVDLQKDDLHIAATLEEAVFGIRVFKGGAEGFATVNRPEALAEGCRYAVEIASVSPAEPDSGLGAPSPVTPLSEKPDQAIVALGIRELVDLGAELIRRVKGQSADVRIDGGRVGSTVKARAIATSTGIRLHEESATCDGSLFGLAVSGTEVGSFDYDGQTVRRRSVLESELFAAADRFVTKTRSSLGARKGESFRGTVILSPEAVSSLLIGDLMGIVSARAARTGRSPLVGKVGQTVASELVTLMDEPRHPSAVASCAFDREGTPTAARAIIEAGVFQGFQYDGYEARRAGVAPTGHARGGASSRPMIGPSNLVWKAGVTPFESLCQQTERAVLVNRLSHSSNAVTGEFSGVVKGGFLLRGAERVPIKEVMIAGNLYEVLRAISAVSSEARWLDGSESVPAIRIEDVSVTAG